MISNSCALIYVFSKLKKCKIFLDEIVILIVAKKIVKFKSNLLKI